MRVIALLMTVYLIFLSGCAKKSDNIYMGIEEKDNTETYTIRQTEEETTDNSNSIDKNLVKYFIDDSHFYDNEEGIDFAGFDETNEKYHVKILDAYTSDKPEDFGEYFSGDIVKGRLEEMKNFCMDIGYEEADLTYLCVKIEITNNSAGNAVLPIGNAFEYVSRINDKRGQKFGLADMRIELTSP